MLIIENQIPHLYRRPNRGYNDAAKPENAETVEVFVSYFGILLDPKLLDSIKIRFLKTVEIGRILFPVLWYR